MQNRRLILSLLFVGLIASVCAVDKGLAKSYKERFQTCEKRREIFKPEEYNVEKCKFLARSTVYYDCIDEEERCVEEGKKDCHKNLLKCIETYASG